MNTDGDVLAISRISAVPRILDVVCRITGMGFAVVARVTADRWVACAVKDEIEFGLAPGGELELVTTICHEIQSHRQPVIIADVAQDDQYRDHHTPRVYGLGSYIAYPVMRRNGEFFGTLCAIDPNPARIDSVEVRETFSLFAELIGFHLDAEEDLLATEATLLQEQETALLREQFIAVLGHDLRNPLASIGAGSNLLRKYAQDPKALSILKLMEESTSRATGLVDDLLDLARGRLGGGLSLEFKCVDLAPILGVVISELKAAWPDRRIVSNLDLPKPVRCDPGRMAQLLSNLIANALTHGDKDEAIRVDVSIEDQTFALAVSNSGIPIPPQELASLFQPFFRGRTRPSQNGLGLGLYIVSEIAKAHGAQIAVASTEEQTRFALTMPVG